MVFFSNSVVPTDQDPKNISQLSKSAFISQLSYILVSLTPIKDTRELVEFIIPIAQAIEKLDLYIRRYSITFLYNQLYIELVKEVFQSIVSIYPIFKPAITSVSRFNLFYLQFYYLLLIILSLEISISFLFTFIVTYSIL